MAEIQKYNLAQKAVHGLAEAIRKNHFKSATLLLDSLPERQNSKTIGKLKLACALLERECTYLEDSKSSPEARSAALGKHIQGLDKLSAYYESRGDLYNLAETQHSLGGAYGKLAMLEPNRQKRGASAEAGNAVEFLRKSAGNYEASIAQRSPFGETKSVIKAMGGKGNALSDLSRFYAHINEPLLSAAESLNAAKEAVRGAEAAGDKFQKSSVVHVYDVAIKELDACKSQYEKELYGTFNTVNPAEISLGVRGLIKLAGLPFLSIIPSEIKAALLIAADESDLRSHVNNALAHLLISDRNAFELYRNNVDFSRGKELRGIAELLASAQA